MQGSKIQQQVMGRFISFIFLLSTTESHEITESHDIIQNHKNIGSSRHVSGAKILIILRF